MAHKGTLVRFREYVSRKVIATFFVDCVPHEKEYVKVGDATYVVSQVHHEFAKTDLTEENGGWRQLTIVTVGPWEYWID